LLLIQFRFQSSGFRIGGSWFEVYGLRYEYKVKQIRLWDPEIKWFGCWIWRLGCVVL